MTPPLPPSLATRASSKAVTRRYQGQKDIVPKCTYYRTASETRIGPFQSPRYDTNPMADRGSESQIA